MEVAIIGLGNFGGSLVQQLYELGHTLTAVDSDPRAIARVQDFCQQAVVGDATDRVLLEELGIRLMDTAIISMGSHLGASILVTLHLREMGIKRIIVKAISPEHEKILLKVGASQVVFPERDAAHRLAMHLEDPNVLDYLPLGADYSVAEMNVPDILVGQSLLDLDVRKKYEVTIIAVKERGAEKPRMITTPDYTFQAGDVLVALGRPPDLEKFRNAH